MNERQPLRLALAAALCTLGLHGTPVLATDQGEHAGHDGHQGHMESMDHSAHQAHAAPGGQMDELPPEAAKVSFADVRLTDQNEHEVSLRDEVVKDSIVVMSFIYTDCTTVCPVVSAIMNKLQSQLGERAGREVRLVSISVDPLNDTPERLREYAGHFRAGPGWTWLTGTVPAINDTLKGLGTWSVDYGSHPPVIMVGDGRTGQWTRFYGFTDPNVLLAKVDELHVARNEPANNGQPDSLVVKGDRP